MVKNVPFSGAVNKKNASKHGVCNVSGVHVATNSHVCEFQTLAFLNIVAGLKSAPIFTFALASIWHEQSRKTEARAIQW